MITDSMRAALYHGAKGCFPESAEVPVGLYNLSGHAVLITFADGSAVERGVGTAGDGLDRVQDAPKDLTMAVVTRFLERAGLTGPALKDAWTAALVDVLTSPVPRPDRLPDEAILAAQEVRDAMGGPVQVTRKTAARRVGIKSATVQALTPHEAFALSAYRLAAG